MGRALGARDGDTVAGPPRRVGHQSCRHGVVDIRRIPKMSRFLLQQMQEEREPQQRRAPPPLPGRADQPPGLARASGSRCNWKPAAPVDWTLAPLPAGRSRRPARPGLSRTASRCRAPSRPAELSGGCQRAPRSGSRTIQHLKTTSGPHPPCCQGRRRRTAMRAKMSAGRPFQSSCCPALPAAGGSTAANLPAGACHRCPNGPPSATRLRRPQRRPTCSARCASGSTR